VNHAGGNRWDTILSEIESSDRDLKMCALAIPADQISEREWRTRIPDFIFGDTQTVAQPGRHNSNREVDYASINMDHYGTCLRVLYDWMRNAQFLNA
jgi:hypothetical protein